MRKSLRIGALVAGALALSACTTPAIEAIGQDPEIMPRLTTSDILADLPAPTQRMTAAVYNFRDQTGQRKPNPNVAEVSTAVTQGGDAILVDAAFRAGNGSWFSVVERAGLEGLLQERQIIRQTREQHGDERQMTPLTFGGVLLEGGIISYDTNTVTGGAGARLLGIGGSTEYRADTVAVYLRLVSVNSGEIVESVNISNTLYSYQIQGDVFRFVSADRLLELEAGATANEPTQVAVRQSIEAAVHALIMEGAMRGLWEFEDEAAGERAIEEYLQMRDGVVAETPDVPRVPSDQQAAGPQAGQAPAAAGEPGAEPSLVEGQLAAADGYRPAGGPLIADRPAYAASASEGKSGDDTVLAFDDTVGWDWQPAMLMSGERYAVRGV